MIDISKLTPADTGRWVIFTYMHGETQRGKIKNWNKTNIWCVFRCGDDWANYQNYTGEGCQPDQLQFLDEFIKAATASSKPVTIEVLAARYNAVIADASANDCTKCPAVNKQHLKDTDDLTVLCDGRRVKL